MLRLLTCPLLLLCSLLSFTQPLWVYEYNDTAPVSFMTDAIGTQDGETVFLTGKRTLGCSFHRASVSGEVLSEGRFNTPGLVPCPERIVGESGDEWLFTGEVGPPFQTEGPPTRAALFRVGADMEPLSYHTGGHECQWVAYSENCVDNNGNIRMAYQCFLDDLSQTDFAGITFSPTGEVLDSAYLTPVFASPSIGSLYIHPNGKVVMSTTAMTWYPEEVMSGGQLSYFDGSWQLDTAFRLPQVTPGSTFLHNVPQWPIYAIPLPSGNVVVSAHYWKVFGNDRGAVLQRVSTSGELLSQWTAESPFLQELPAWLQGIDMAADGSLYYAQMNNWTLMGVDGFSPSQVEVFHLDTSFNVLGSFLFDGYEDNTYYYPSVVRATPDGGVLVGGSKKALSGTDQRPKAWLAKFGPDGLVGVNEAARPLAGIAPNPGTMGFQVMLGEPLPGGTLALYDLHGRMVMTETINGAQAQVHASNLAPGVYSVVIRAADGTPKHAQRWVKQ